MIRHKTARKLAYNWHGGQWSPLYAFASSGIVTNLNELKLEIQNNATQALSAGRTKDAEECDKLLTYVKALPLDLISGNHMATWAKP